MCVVVFAAVLVFAQVWAGGRNPSRNTPDILTGVLSVVDSRTGQGSERKQEYLDNWNWLVVREWIDLYERNYLLLSLGRNNTGVRRSDFSQDGAVTTMAHPLVARLGERERGGPQTRDGLLGQVDETKDRLSDAGGEDDCLQVVDEIRTLDP